MLIPIMSSVQTLCSPACGGEVPTIVNYHFSLHFRAALAPAKQVRCNWGYVALFATTVMIEEFSVKGVPATSE